MIRVKRLRKLQKRFSLPWATDELRELPQEINCFGEKWRRDGKSNRINGKRQARAVTWDRKSSEAHFKWLRFMRNTMSRSGMRRCDWHVSTSLFGWRERVSRDFEWRTSILSKILRNCDALIVDLSFTEIEIVCAITVNIPSLFYNRHQQAISLVNTFLLRSNKSSTISDCCRLKV